MTSHKHRQPPFRRGTALSRATIAARLGLRPADGFDQDWEITSADASRLAQFLTLYERAPDLTEDERFTLMEIIIASLDDAFLDATSNPDMEIKIRAILIRDFAIHAYTVHYCALWHRGVSLPTDEMFATTPFMRVAWTEAMSAAEKSGPSW